MSLAYSLQPAKQFIHTKQQDTATSTEHGPGFKYKYHAPLQNEIR
jgi:hypothetical protein